MHKVQQNKIFYEKDTNSYIEVRYDRHERFKYIMLMKLQRSYLERKNSQVSEN